MKRFAAPLALAALLGGCAVYGPPPAGYAAYPYSPEPVYAAPAPVYAAPAPVYAPPVSFSFGFLFGGHGGGHWRHR